VVGGTAPPIRLMRALDKHNLQIMHLWGMTETTPLATVGRLKRHMLDWTEDDRYEVRGKQGWAAPFIELRVTRPGPEGKDVEAPRDGETPGELEVRGPWSPPVTTILPTRAIAGPRTVGSKPAMSRPWTTKASSKSSTAPRTS
jgi:acyl-CoA synthetase (AMP-forming)/AMP-acid ligase II